MMPKPSKIDETEYRQLVARGKTYREMAEHLGVAIPTIYGFVNVRLNRDPDFPRPPRYEGSSRHRKLKNAADKSGVTLGHIGNELNKSDRSTVEKIHMKAASQGYETIAEYAVDLMLEELLNGKDTAK
jgi:transposase